MTGEDYRADISGMVCRRMMCQSSLEGAKIKHNFLKRHKTIPPTNAYTALHIEYKLIMLDVSVALDTAIWTVLRRQMMKTLKGTINYNTKKVKEYTEAINKLEEDGKNAGILQDGSRQEVL